jgi:hypothetical protein
VNDTSTKLRTVTARLLRHIHVGPVPEATDSQQSPSEDWVSLKELAREYRARLSEKESKIKSECIHPLTP